jgi:23S rRNA (guanosine2251-2'-O)-methyltransferase
MDYLYRRNTVLESLRASRRKFESLYLQKGAQGTHEIATLAKRLNIPIKAVSKGKLTHLAGDRGHQGVVLETGPFEYSDINEILLWARTAGEQPFLLLLDLLHGPQNIGTLLRTAEACGIHGVIIQDRRAPEISPTVVMYSAGAAEHLRIAQVTNLPRTIQRLKQEEIWIVGLALEEEALSLEEVELDIPIGIVIGHEGQGLRRLVRKRCDYLIRLPMRGRVDSLNAATAGSIMLYMAWQARGYDKAKVYE